MGLISWVPVFSIRAVSSFLDILTKHLFVSIEKLLKLINFFKRSNYILKQPGSVFNLFVLHCYFGDFFSYFDKNIMLLIKIHNIKEVQHLVKVLPSLP